jgi:hypothetical protein
MAIHSPRPTPAPASYTDSFRLDWVERNMMECWTDLCGNRWSHIHIDVVPGQSLRNAIDAAIDHRSPFRG